MSENIHGHPEENTSEGTKGSNYFTRKPGGTAQACESPWQWGGTGEMHKELISVDRTINKKSWVQRVLHHSVPLDLCPCLNTHLRKRLPIRGPDLYWALWVLLHHKQQVHEGFQKPDPCRNAGEQEPRRWGEKIIQRRTLHVSCRGCIYVF